MVDVPIPRSRIAGAPDRCVHVVAAIRRRGFLRAPLRRRAASRRGAPPWSLASAPMPTAAPVGLIDRLRNRGSWRTTPHVIRPVGPVAAAAPTRTVDPQTGAHRSPPVPGPRAAGRAPIMRRSTETGGVKPQAVTPKDKGQWFGEVRHDPPNHQCMQKLRRVFHLTHEISFTSRPHCGNAPCVGVLIVVLAVVALVVFERQIGGSGG